MSDHQPAVDDPDLDGNADPASEKTGCDASERTATDLHELDFSRLRMARASLDAAFPER